MALAISFKSESSDYYTFAFDGLPTASEVIERIDTDLGSEVAYLYVEGFDATITDRVEYQKYRTEIVDAVVDHIDIKNENRDDEDYEY